LCVFVLGIYLAIFGQWKLETNLLSLLPTSSNDQEIQLAEKALFSHKEQQLVVLISGDNSISAHQMLQHAINEIAQISSVNLPEPSLTEITQFYLPYRHNFLSQQYLDNINNKQELTRLFTSQMIELANPFVSETLSTAPRLNLAHYLQATLEQMEGIEYYQGVPSITFQQQRYLFSRLALNFNGFSLKLSQELSVELQHLFKQIENTHQVELLYSGILFHTAESTTQAKNEISTFGLLSLLSVFLLILLVFRSFLPLIISSFVISIATFYGLTAVFVFFEKVHLLTLVFAVTLVGIVIDYCFHTFVYIGSVSQDTLKRKHTNISQPLILGFITTALGYFFLVFSPLALLAQVAVFMIFGLMGALFSVLIILPRFKSLNKFQVTSSILTLSQRCISLLQRFRYIRIYIFVCVVITLLVMFFKLPTVFNDDIRLLNSSPTWLITQEKRVAETIGYQEITRIVVKADNRQSLLENQEKVIDKIRAEQPLLLIKSIAGLLPSIERQQEYFRQLNQADKAGNFVELLAMSGMSDPILPFTPLTFERFMQGPLSSISQLFLAAYPITLPNGSVSEKHALWIEVSGGALTVDLRNWIEKNSDSKLYNKADDVSKVLSYYRTELLFLLGMAFVIVALVLTLKYGFKSGLLATVATISSALIALFSSQLLIGYLNIFNLLAVLLILALAIDYVIFYQEHGLKDRTFIAISLSALSSALVFGVLMFSATPAVNSFGLTVMIGIIAIYILAPISASKSQY